MKGFIQGLASVVMTAVVLAGCGGLTSTGNPAALTPTAGGSSILPTPTRAGTNPAPTSSEPAATASVVAATAAPTATLLPAAKNNQYQITARFDYNRHTLSADEQVTVTNSGPEAYANLALQVEPDNQAGEFTLKSISLAGGQPTHDFTLAKNRLTISLARPLLPGQSSQVSLSFELALPLIPPPSDTARPVVRGYTDRQTNLVDWFPYVPPYVAGQGWVIHDPGYFGEHQVYPEADFDVTLTLVSPPAGLKIAAAGPAEAVSGGYHYLLTHARTFAWSASPTYVVQTQTAGDVTILSYNFPLDDAAAKMALKNTADAVTLYSQLFGPYQHSTLTVVEADFLDGMEEDGLYFLSKGFYNLYDGTPKGYLTIIAAHETAHQWWFGMVGSDQAMEPWLDEALSTYCERIYYENIAPSALTWWWEVRVNYYKPRGFVDDSIYNPHHEASAYRAYRDAVYLNGATFIEALRKQIGDDAFYAFLKDYCTQFTGKVATSADFFSILREHTSADLSTLIKTYFSTPR